MAEESAEESPAEYWESPKASLLRSQASSAHFSDSWAREPEESILTPLWHLGMDLDDVFGELEAELEGCPQHDEYEGAAIESF